MFRIVIDSAGDLPSGWKDEFDIEVIPVNIHFGERTYLQGVDLTNAGFYQMVSQNKTFPKTSQPSPQQFLEFYRKIAAPGDTILSLHVTGKLSGTFSSAVMAAREAAGEFQVAPFDTGCGSAGQAFMAREARCMERSGASLEQILRRMEEIRGQMQIILTLATLEYARRSGRVRALQAVVASLLNVKPVIILKDGVLELAERIRTRHKALDFVADEMARRLEGKPANVAIVHSEDPQGCRILGELACSRLNVQDFIETELSIGIAANLGPGTVGIVAYPVDGGVSK
jgi:DegV family protein with EDD domain